VDCPRAGLSRLVRPSLRLVLLGLSFVAEEAAVAVADFRAVGRSELLSEG